MAKGGQLGWTAVAPMMIRDNDAACHRAFVTPPNIERGMIAGVVRIGVTRKTEEWAQLEGWESVEQRALVPRAGIAKYSTQVSEPRWLHKGVKRQGMPNVWMVRLDVEHLTS